MYYFENGLRKVTPYYLRFKTHPKPRWIGKTVLEIFTTEFADSEEALIQDIKDELLYIEENFGKKGGTNTIRGLESLRWRKTDRFDVIHNSKHMHEPSVPDTEVGIVFEDDEFLVIDKPSGIPTHPTGNYFYNSITEILKKENGYVNLWPFHRLDKVTSGILIFGKSKAASQKYHDLFQGNRDKITKTYIARVVGNFPEEETMVNCPIFMVNSTGGYIKPLNAEMLPVNSTTVFTRLKYNEEMNESVVLCKPLTGKMHQIRIHLRNLGFPIANDVLYNPSIPELPNHEVNTINNSIEVELYKRIFQKHPEFGQFQRVDPSVVKSDECIDLFTITNFRNDCSILSQVEKLIEIRQANLQKLKDDHDTVCDVCQREIFTSDKDMTDSGIWLHSYKYECDEENGFQYTTELPKWADI
ncbi:DRAP deaminase and pseudouridylate synthase [Scheffersomyces coipomensis]|uniref:DRAP deaminase and pseudouridylate synthase n=1 Tax=Scheffersomyces coipomensis TaxID=1788519 RepID=UPI00315D9AA0